MSKKKDNVLGTNENIDGMSVHCSATENFKPVKPIDIHRNHIVKRKFDGIGYHWIIQPDGSAEAGRPEYWTGAHVKGHNEGKIAVMLIGTDQFTPAQFNTLETLARAKKKQYGYPSRAIKGHRDYSPDEDGNGTVDPDEWLKSCPGFSVRKFVKERCI